MAHRMSENNKHLSQFPTVHGDVINGLFYLINSPKLKDIVYFFCFCLNHQIINSLIILTLVGEKNTS